MRKIDLKKLKAMRKIYYKRFCSKNTKNDNNFSNYWL